MSSRAVANMCARSTAFAVPSAVCTIGLVLVIASAAPSYITAFVVRDSPRVQTQHVLQFDTRSRRLLVSYMSAIPNSGNDGDGAKVDRSDSVSSSASSVNLSSDMLASSIDQETQSNPSEEPPTALTGTVNERLLVELEQAANQEKFGSSKMAERLRQFSFRSSKTEEERQAAIAEARDLNGVNPIVALLGSIFALACAFGLWILTNTLAEFFAFHPIESDVFFVARVSAVGRNVVMGLAALASGFFGVTGLGILLLSIRVAYGVVTGELDPTPIKTSVSTPKNVDVQNMWDLMLNKKNKRGQR